MFEQEASDDMDMYLQSGERERPWSMVYSNSIDFIFCQYSSSTVLPYRQICICTAKEKDNRMV